MAKSKQNQNCKELAAEALEALKHLNPLHIIETIDLNGSKVIPFQNEGDARIFFDNYLLTQVKIALKEDFNWNFSIHWYSNDTLIREFMIQQVVFEK